MTESKNQSMGDRRALLTDREREIIAGEADVTDSYRYQTISRVRTRFDRLKDDLAALEAHGGLAEDFREAVYNADDAMETGDEVVGGEISSESLPSADVYTRSDENIVDVESLSFANDLISEDRDVLTDWLHHARNTREPVTKADFEQWWSDDHTARTDHDCDSFWRLFARMAMKQSDAFVQPTPLTYQYVGT